MSASFSNYAQHSLRDLIIKTRVSRSQQAYVIALHALALLAVWLPANLPSLISLIVTPLILHNAGFMLRDILSAGDLIWRADAQIEFQPQIAFFRANSRPLLGTVTTRSIHCFMFVLLVLHGEDKKSVYCMIARDAVSLGDFRRLRARLYLGKRMSLNERR